MTEPGERMKVPWGLILTITGLSAVLFGIYRLTPGLDGSGAWPTILGIIGIGVSGFLILRWLQNYAWGLLAGLLLPLHPLVRDAGQVVLLSETLALIALASVVGAWGITFLSRFAWRSWVLAILVLGQGLGLAWCFDPRSGLMASVLAGAGLVLAALLAILLHARGKGDLPSWCNIGLACLVGVGTPVAALTLGLPVFRAFGGRPNVAINDDSAPTDLLRAGLAGPIEDYQLHGFKWDELARWAWPEVWVVLALMAWGLFRSLRRGWRLWRRGKAPTAWVLTLYSVIAIAGACAFAGPAEKTGYLTLACLAVLLSVYGIADLARGFMEKLVLAPPQERDQ
jgi:hypothetical protein